MEKEKVGCQVLKETVVKTNDSTKKLSEKDRRWEKPVLEDVSGRVMAQPYIRFT